MITIKYLGIINLVKIIIFQYNIMSSNWKYTPINNAQCTLSGYYLNPINNSLTPPTTYFLRVVDMTVPSTVIYPIVFDDEQYEPLVVVNTALDHTYCVQITDQKLTTVENGFYTFTSSTSIAEFPDALIINGPDNTQDFSFGQGNQICVNIQSAPSSDVISVIFMINNLNGMLQEVFSTTAVIPNLVAGQTQFIFNNIEPGTYEISGCAFNGNGSSDNSNTISVTVENSIPPPTDVEVVCVPMTTNNASMEITWTPALVMNEEVITGYLIQKSNVRNLDSTGNYTYVWTSVYGINGLVNGVTVDGNTTTFTDYNYENSLFASNTTYYYQILTVPVQPTPDILNFTSDTDYSLPSTIDSQIAFFLPDAPFVEVNDATNQQLNLSIFPIEPKGLVDIRYNILLNGVYNGQTISQSTLTSSNNVDVTQYMVLSIPLDLVNGVNYDVSVEVVGTNPNLDTDFLNATSSEKTDNCVPFTVFPNTNGVGGVVNGGDNTTQLDGFNVISTMIPSNGQIIATWTNPVDWSDSGLVIQSHFAYILYNNNTQYVQVEITNGVFSQEVWTGTISNPNISQNNILNIFITPISNVNNSNSLISGVTLLFDNAFFVSNGSTGSSGPVAYVPFAQPTISALAVPASLPTTEPVVVTQIQLIINQPIPDLPLFVTELGASSLVQMYTITRTNGDNSIILAQITDISANLIVNNTELYFVDTNVVQNNTYTYSVSVDIYDGYVYNATNTVAFFNSSTVVGDVTTLNINTSNIQVVTTESGLDSTFAFNYPSVVTDLSFNGFNGLGVPIANGQIILNWNAPTDNGGYDIDHYNIYNYSYSDAPQFTTANNVTTITISQELYTQGGYTVSAVIINTETGTSYEGVYTNSIIYTVSYTNPVDITTFSVVPSNHQITLNWGQVDMTYYNHGCFSYVDSSFGTNPWYVITQTNTSLNASDANYTSEITMDITNASSNSYTFNELINGNSYTYNITCNCIVNNSGSTFTRTLTSTGVNSTQSIPYGLPLNMSVTSTTNSAGAQCYSVVVSPNGSPIADYFALATPTTANYTDDLTCELINTGYTSVLDNQTFTITFAMVTPATNIFILVINQAGYLVYNSAPIAVPN